MKAAVAMCLAAGLGVMGSTAHAAGKPKSVKVTLETSDARPAGTIVLVNKKKGVEFVVNLENLDPGQHGIHIHEFPKCDAPTFKSAGGHFNPFNKQHGYQNPEGHHAGDTPMNLVAGDDGMVKTSFLVEGLTLDPSAKNSVFANGGTSIVVHAAADDMKSNPAGNAGAREACGIVSPDNASTQNLAK